MTNDDWRDIVAELETENERLRKENKMLEGLRAAWQLEANRLKTLYNLERLLKRA